MSDWEPVHDNASGKTYYWNKATDETTWTLPVSAALAGSPGRGSSVNSHVQGLDLAASPAPYGVPNGAQNIEPKDSSFGSKLTDFFESFWDTQDDRKARIYFILLPLIGLLAVWVLVIVGLALPNWFEWCVQRSQWVSERYKIGATGIMSLEQTWNGTAVGRSEWDIWGGDFTSCDGSAFVCSQIYAERPMSCSAFRDRADLTTRGDVWKDAWKWRAAATCPIARATLAFGIMSVIVATLGLALLLVALFLSNPWSKSLALFWAGVTTVFLVVFLFLDIVIYGGGASGAFRPEYALGVDVNWWLGPGYALHITAFFLSVPVSLWMVAAGYFSMMYFKEGLEDPIEPLDGEQALYL